jgi:predicted small secreted protein
LRRLLRWLDVVQQDATTTGVGIDLEEATEMADVVEQDATTTGVGRDLEEAAEMVRRSAA